MYNHCGGSASRRSGTGRLPPPPPAGAAGAAAGPAPPPGPRLLACRCRPRCCCCCRSRQWCCSSAPRVSRGVAAPSLHISSCGGQGSSTWSEAVRARAMGLVASCSVRSFLPNCRSRADRFPGRRPLLAHHTDTECSFAHPANGVPRLGQPTCAVAESMLMPGRSSSVRSEGGSRRRLPGDGGRSSPRACITHPGRSESAASPHAGSCTASASGSAALHEPCPADIYPPQLHPEPACLLAQPVVGAGGRVAALLLARRLAPAAAAAARAAARLAAGVGGEGAVVQLRVDKGGEGHGVASVGMDDSEC